MQTRRQFIRTAAAFTGAAGLIGPIERAMAIEPEKGSSVLDAEHVVILMQENRSFDHSFGTLQGVRGFNDPRTVQHADGTPVFVQRNTDGEKYSPFRLDIQETKTTWMGCLPHSWTDQVDAANGGKHDRWLPTKRHYKKEWATMPLTMGYHTREDLPFYYALADAFTICDQNFCSTLTGTTPNRLHLWTGTIREKPDPATPALVRNSDCDYGAWVNWTTFPERLEDAGVNWKIYQNELTVPSGLAGEEESWLSNFGDNPIEWFTQHHVRFAGQYQSFIAKRIPILTADIESLTKQLETKKDDAAAATLKKKLAQAKDTLARFRKDREDFTPEKFEQLPQREKNLFLKAFTTNKGDPAYRELAEISYKDGEATRRVKVPKGDVLYQFRKDVADGKLPTVSWLVPPERFSDHPCSAWYGQWYLSEVLDILTKNPEVWKKTVFILTYDENDGYFDHVPPFQAPHPKKPESGLASQGLDTALDHLELDVDKKRYPNSECRGNSLGLGYRVPMVVASPWSRGGCVCSQVFDHTSVIQFVEKLVTHKTGKKFEETNITAWRRTICGDLTSSFQSAAELQPGLKGFLRRDQYVEGIHKAQFKKLPGGFKPLDEKTLELVRTNPKESVLPQQEPGVRKSSPLPYELGAEGQLNGERTQYSIRLTAGNEKFGKKACGSPFIAYAHGSKGVQVRHYAVAAGKSVEDSWDLAIFGEGMYHFRIHGPNGFFREFTGNAKEQKVNVELGTKGDGGVELRIRNYDSEHVDIVVRDNAYGLASVLRTVSAGHMETISIPANASGGWYDLSVTSPNQPGGYRYAGRVETGRWSITDPFMGGGDAQ